MTDLNVKVKYFSKTDKGDLMLEFDHKETPFEMDINCGVHADRGTIELSGSLGEGEIVVKLMGSSTHELWSHHYQAGVIQHSQDLEIYGGKYTLCVEFNGAKNGNVHLKYRTNKILGIF